MDRELRIFYCSHAYKHSKWCKVTDYHQSPVTRRKIFMEDHVKFPSHAPRCWHWEITQSCWQLPWGGAAGAPRSVIHNGPNPTSFGCCCDRHPQASHEAPGTLTVAARLLISLLAHHYFSRDFFLFHSLPPQLFPSCWSGTHWKQVWHTHLTI